VAPFSVRPVATAPVSMPLVWDEVVPGLSARKFTIANALARVTGWPGDPCLRVLDERPDLAAVLDRLGQLVKE
jgi:DNA primase